MRVVATLLTDVALDERAFRGVLFAVSRSSLAGAITQDGLEAVHAFGDAAEDLAVRDVRVRCRRANTAPKAALTELRKLGFLPVTALEIEAAEDPESLEDAWAVAGLYARELRGWLVTSYLDFEDAAARAGTREGLVHAPVGGKHKGVLIAASTLELLTP